MDTQTDGRIDIVIFPNGGREFIGRVASHPETPEDIYRPAVEEFVATKQGLEHPQKFTAHYSVKNGIIDIHWGSYEGELPRPPLPTMEELEKQRYEREMQATRGQGIKRAIPLPESYD